MNINLLQTKKFLSLLVCILILSSFPFIAFADSGWQQDFALPRWTYILRVSGGVMDETDSSGRHEVGGVAFARDPDNRVDINATVQKYNGDWYNTSYKWSDSGYAGASVSEYVYLAPGAYRMRLIVKIYSPSNFLLEETTLYTDETLI